MLVIRNECEGIDAVPLVSIHEDLSVVLDNIYEQYCDSANNAGSPEDRCEEEWKEKALKILLEGDLISTAYNEPRCTAALVFMGQPGHDSQVCLFKNNGGVHRAV